MVAGLIVVPVVSILTPKMDTKSVDAVFECFEETVTVRRKRSIEE
jgi:SSS family solute:Na+ symporter